MQAVSKLTAYGGDLSGGDGLQSKGLENDVGSGLELERGLESAQEAWLNEQRHCG